MKMTDVEKQLVRLKRADDLGIEISNKIQAWSKNNLDSKIVLAKDGKSWYLELLVKDEPPFDEWSMLFSDSIGQLRSVLDNFVYSVLTPLANGKNLPNKKIIKFPIATTPKQWKSAEKSIKHIPEPYYSRIKKVQPFNRIGQEDEGTLDGLVALQKLSNSDKHNLQIKPEIDTSNLQHDYAVEYETYEDAAKSLPPQVEILKPVFKDGSHLIRQQSKGKIKSVEGSFRIESQVLIRLDGTEMGITHILAGLWEYTALLMVHVADLPRKEFEHWANNL